MHVSASAQQAAATDPTATDPATTDKYLWLEDVSSAHSMAWVNAEDDRSLKVREADPHYATYHDEALKLAEAIDRVAYPEQRAGGDLQLLARRLACRRHLS
jgi:prolyl oligopeptidase